MGPFLKKAFSHQATLLVLFFLISFIVYLPSLDGGPIWDDFAYLFRNNTITGDFSYWAIFKDYAWPFSVSAEKFFYGIWKEEYLYYHLLNLFLHMLNTFLLLKLLERLKLPYPRFAAFLFLLHPANVISVSWMIQLKTLLCFTFAIASFFFLLKGLEDKRYYVPAWLSFLISVLSKSASLPLSVFFLIYAVKQKGKSQILWAIPFFLISSYSTYKILRSEVTILASIQVASKSYVVEEDSKGVVPAPSVERTEAPKPKVPEAEVNFQEPETQSFMARVNLIVKTSNYYFWQTLLPMDSYPVKGTNPKAAGMVDWLHLAFIGILIYLTWKTRECALLISGYLMLSPFLGIFTAPYMTLTWVSEQHLYLVLPFLICFWMGILARWKFKFAKVIPVLFLIFFSVQTYRAAHYYKNEIIFYGKSLNADPFNIPIAYNLAVAHLKQNDLQGALTVTGTMIEMAHDNKELRENKYFSYIATLHGKLVKASLQEP